MIFIKKYKLGKYSKYLKKNLSKYRYKHSIKVAKKAVNLAKRYSCDMKKAAIAGLIHDIAREYSPEKIMELAVSDGNKIEKFEKDNPVLLHGRAGAMLALSLFNIKDNEILESIRNHTLGCPNMNLLSKIIFAADYVVPRKSHYNKDLANIYKITEIDYFLIKILESMIAYDKRKNRKILKPVSDLYQKLKCGV